MSEEKQEPAEVPGTEAPTEAEGSRFPELDELQREVTRRIRDNQRFLERFMDDDFEEEPAAEEEPPDEEEFEEL